MEIVPGVARIDLWGGASARQAINATVEVQRGAINHRGSS